MRRVCAAAPRARFVRAASTFKAVNPATGEVAWEEPKWTAKQAVEAVERTHAVFDDWRHMPVETRCNVLREASAILKDRVDEFARTITIEMGKPITEAKGEVLKCTTILEYYAANAERLLGVREVQGNPDVRSLVTKQPLGAVLLIMPWNFPFWQVFRQASAALAAGNVTCLKHAANVPRCARYIEEVFATAAGKAGAPTAIFVNLPVSSGDIAPVMEHHAVRAVSLTGSSHVGSLVGAAAGKLLKPSVLELGGNDPSVILEDADIAHTAKCCAAGRMLNGGQSCIGAKRFIAVEQVYDKFVEAFKAEMESYKMDDPLLETTRLGSMVDTRARDEVHGQTKETIDKGARCILGGSVPDRKGAFYPPTVLCEVPKGSVGYDEEIFGPVASVMKAKDEKEAIAIANSSRYGLGSSVYTTDLERGERIAREEMQSGLSFVNDFVKSDARLPFGGVKDSGYGRECGEVGLDAFCNIKTVVVRGA
eukprot:Sspe_Gene.4759::Locus_1563_Transcript_2_2_Confidence_0.800_Length_1542::g.4759::m.4759/K00135/gabD; succinate-semialdehyde dehydrogenase / glutarate-semialdehyde dehydrogenase